MGVFKLNIQLAKLQNNFRFYGLLTTLFAILITLYSVIIPVVSDIVFFVIFSCAILMTAWFGRFGIGLVLVLFAIALRVLLVLQAQIFTNHDIVQMLLFIIEGVLIYGTSKYVYLIQQVKELDGVRNNLLKALKAADINIYTYDLDMTPTLVFQPQDIPVSDVTVKTYGDNLQSNEITANLKTIQENVLATGARQHQYMSIAKDKSLSKLAVTGNPLKTQNGTVEGVVVATTDITEIVHELKAYNKYEDIYRVLMTVFEHAFCICELLFDDEGNPNDYLLLEVNQEFERHTGLQDAQGKTAMELVPDLEFHWVETYSRVVLNREAVYFEHQSVVMDRWFEVNAIPVGEEDKYLFALVFRDVSHRKVREQEADKQYDVLTQIIDSLPVMITIYTPVKDVLYLNREFEKLIGWTNDDLATIDLMEEIYPDPEYRADAQQYMESAIAGWQEFDLMARDGTVIHSSWANIALKDGRQVGIGIDVRERMRSIAYGQVLQILTASLSSVLTLPEISTVIIEKGIEALNASKGTIYLLNDKTKTLQMIASVGYSEELLDGWYEFSLDHPDSPIASAVRDGIPEWTNNFTPDYAHHDSHKPVLSILPLRVGDKVIGAMTLSFDNLQQFDTMQKDFLTTLAEYSAQALHRGRLTMQIETIASRNIRQRLSSDLHDSVKQVLTTSMRIAEVLPKLWQENREKALEFTELIVKLNRAAYADLQGILLEMLPEAIISTPLPDLIKNLSEGVEGHKEIDVTLNFDCPQELFLPQEAHIAVYRIVQEALHNVRKHSKSKQLRIDCVYDSGQLKIEISDNGKGFDLANRSFGFGLQIMSNRAETIGATFNIQSEVGKGTDIVLKWDSGDAA